MATKQQYAVAIVNDETPGQAQVTIAAAGTTSTALQCFGTAPVGIFFPANWTACNIGILVSKNGVDYYTLTDFAGVVFVAATNPAQFLPLLPSITNSILNIKIVASVAQVTESIVDFALAPIYQGIHA